MACLYNDNLINMYSEDTILKFCDLNTVEELLDMYDNLLKDKDRKSSKSLYCFENYIIKNYKSIDNQQLKEKIKSIINNIYNRISISNIKDISELTYISNLFKSTITREDIINIFATEKQKEEIRKTKYLLANSGNRLARKFNNYFDMTYNNSEDKKIDLSKYELSYEEKKLLINYLFILKNDKSDSLKWLDEIEEKLFVDIISNPKSNSDNVYEKEFISKYAINNFFKIENVEKPEFTLVDNDKEKNIGGTATGRSYLEINTSSILNKTNLDLIGTVCHETEHIVQSQRMRKTGMYNTLGYFYLIHELARKYPQKNNTSEKEYMDNYEYLEVEVDAEKTANKKLEIYVLDLYRKYGLDADLCKEKINQRKAMVNYRRPDFISRKNLNGKSVPTYNYNMERLSEIVESNPALINEYKILSLIFDKNGKKKDCSLVIQQKMIYNQIINDYILNEVYKNKEISINTDKFTDEEQKQFIENISVVFTDELNKLINFLRNPQLIYKTSATSSFIDDMNMVSRLNNILGKNFDLIRNNKLIPDVYNKIDKFIEVYNENINVLRGILCQNNINDCYYSSLSAVVKMLEYTIKKYKDYRYHLEVEHREEYVKKNNLLNFNKSYINNIREKLGNDNPFFQALMRDNMGNAVSVNDFLDNFVIPTMINKEIINYSRGNVTLNSVIVNLFMAYDNNTKKQSSNSKSL